MAQPSNMIFIAACDQPAYQFNDAAIPYGVSYSARLVELGKPRMGAARHAVGARADFSAWGSFPGPLTLKDLPEHAARASSSGLCQEPTRAPQQTTVYSITSSARASSAGGTSKPSAFAVLRSPSAPSEPLEEAEGDVEWRAMLTDNAHRRMVRSQSPVVLA